MKRSELSEIFHRIAMSMKAENFDLALSTYRGLEDEFLPSNMLVMKSTAIQLAEYSHGYTLQDAREALFFALELDPENPEILMELGYFHYAVDDNPKEAIPFFEKAISNSRNIYRDSIVGAVNARLELGMKSEAKEVVRIFSSLTSDAKIQDLLALIDEE